MSETGRYNIAIRGYRDVGWVFKTGPAVIDNDAGGEVVSGPWPDGTQLTLVTVALYGRQIPCARVTRPGGTFSDYELREVPE